MKTVNWWRSRRTTIHSQIGNSPDWITLRFLGKRSRVITVSTVATQLATQRIHFLVFIFYIFLGNYVTPLTGRNICVSLGGRYPSVTYASFLGNIARLFIGLTIDLEDWRHWEDLQFEGEREKTVKVRQPTKSNQLSRDDVKATKHSSFQLWPYIQAQGRRRLVERRAENNKVWARDRSYCRVPRLFAFWDDSVKWQNHSGAWDQIYEKKRTKKKNEKKSVQWRE